MYFVFYIYHFVANFMLFLNIKVTFHDFGWRVFSSSVLKELRHIFFINDTVY